MVGSCSGGFGTWKQGSQKGKNFYKYKNPNVKYQIKPKALMLKLKHLDLGFDLAFVIWILTFIRY